MVGPPSFVQPANNEWRGGALSRATLPVDASLSSFSSPGVSGFTTPGNADILTARNNRGTNVRVPYARIVPVSNKSLTGTHGDASETADLDGGELAWVNGLYVTPDPRAGSIAPGIQETDEKNIGMTAGTTPTRKEGVLDILQTVQNALSHTGKGPDRCHRLASTPWVQKYFETTLRSAHIKLHVATGEYHSRIDSDLVDNGRLGLESKFVFGTSPFAYVRDDDDVIKTQKQFYAELFKQGVFNWKPDGICLSKLETGPDKLADAEFDDQLGQMHNIGVQGPCIVKTWSNGDRRMQVLPGDKLFVLLIADVTFDSKVNASTKIPSMYERKVNGEEIQYVSAAPNMEKTHEYVLMDHFHMMPATSSFMCNMSKYNGGKGRGNLKLELADNAASDAGHGEYIVGAWCIGTVMDAAAGRPAVHGGIRSRATTLAYNANVNIEWWDANRLKNAYELD